MEQPTKSLSTTPAPFQQQRCPDIEKLWRLKKALARDNWIRFEDIVAKARTGEYQIHDNPGCVAVTHMPRRADDTVCLVVVAVGGYIHAVNDMMVYLEDFARAQGCATIEFTGRPGWGRFHRGRDHGYKDIAVVSRKDLTDGQLP